MIWLRDDFQQAWSGQDPFAKAESLQGEIFRDMPGRRTLRFEQEGKSFFLKLHFGIGWAEILKNLVRLRLPVLGARNEYEAIRRCERLGVATMVPVAYGLKGRNPAQQESFIVTEDLVDTISLEDLSLDWVSQPPAPRLKRQLLERVARVSKTLHENGINHRDYYICHFLLKIPKGIAGVDPDNFDLHLIDLHRAQLRAKTPKRWIIKDIAGLYFSALDIGLTQRDLYRFICIYTGLPLRQALVQYDWLWRPLRKKAAKLYERKQRYGDAL